MTASARAPVADRSGARCSAEDNVPGISPAAERTAAELPQPTSLPIGQVEHSPAPGFLSRELRELSMTFHGRPVRLADILAATRGSGYHLLLLVLTLPFVSPIPLPGVSIPFGVTVAMVGLRLALHRQPWLPRRVLQYQLPCRFMSSTLRGVSRIVRLVEVLARPRWFFFSSGEVCQRLSGFLTCLSGLMLVLPLPFPFSNSLPAWTVILLSAGALARDGLFFLAGCLSFVVGAAYFVLLAISGQYVLERFLPWFAAH